MCRNSPYRSLCTARWHGDLSTLRTKLDNFLKAVAPVCFLSMECDRLSTRSRHHLITLLVRRVMSQQDKNKMHLQSWCKMLKTGHGLPDRKQSDTAQRIQATHKNRTRSAKRHRTTDLLGHLVTGTSVISPTARAHPGRAVGPWGDQLNATYGCWNR